MVSEKLAQESFSMGKAEVANEATEFRTLAWCSTDAVMLFVLNYYLQTAFKDGFRTWVAVRCTSHSSLG